MFFRNGMVIEWQKVRVQPGVRVRRWRSEEDWQGMPKERLDDLDRRFREAVPEGWELAEVRSYEVA